MVAVTGEIYRTAPGEIDSFTQVGTGNIPITSGDNCRGITWHEDDDQWYVGSEIGLWEVDIADPDSSTKTGNWSSLGTARAHAGLTYLNGSIYTIQQAAPRSLLRVNTSAPVNSTSVGNVQNVSGGRYDYVAASGGALYAVWLQSGSHSLHIVPLENPGTPIVLGGISGLGSGALGGMTAVDIELTTELIPERGNLYYTDDRVKSWLTGLTGYDNGRFLSGVSGTGDPIWSAVGYDGLLDRPVFRVSSVSAIPTPSASNVGRRYQTNEGHQYLIERHTIGHGSRVVNYTAVPTVAQGTAGYRGRCIPCTTCRPAALRPRTPTSSRKPTPSTAGMRGTSEIWMAIGSLGILTQAPAPTKVHTWTKHAPILTSMPLMT